MAKLGLHGGVSRTVAAEVRAAGESLVRLPQRAKHQTFQGACVGGSTGGVEIREGPKMSQAVSSWRSRAEQWHRFISVYMFTFFPIAWLTSVERSVNF